jgi:hypothetical protein
MLGHSFLHCLVQSLHGSRSPAMHPIFNELVELVITQLLLRLPGKLLSKPKRAHAQSPLRRQRLTRASPFLRQQISCSTVSPSAQRNRAGQSVSTVAETRRLAGRPRAQIMLSQRQPLGRGNQIDLHLTEFQRSARPGSPFRLTIAGEIATPVLTHGD